MALRRIELPCVSTGIFSVLRNIWFVAREKKGSILHITGDVHYAALLCLLSRTVITVHDCVVLQRATGFKRFAMKILWFDLPIRLASAVIVISEQTKKELLATVSVPASKVAVIPNFVDPAFEYSERRFAVRHPRILHVGTTPNKNLSRVLAALEGLSCTLVIVGELSVDHLSELRRSELSYEHYFSVDHAKVIELYRAADIISFPSTYEGFGMPILEGQAVGRCVLTSDLEPMRTVAGNGGALLVDPKSTMEIRAAFVALMTDGELRARLISAGRDNACAYSLDSVAARYAAIYRRLDDLSR